MIKSFKLFESKQVGIIYHFTSLFSLYEILSRKEPYLYSSYVNYISCTRDFNMKSPELRLEKQCCRITLDGNKISENFKVKSYFDRTCLISKDDEREERIDTSNKIIDLKKYCLRIDILNNPVLDPDDHFHDNDSNFPPKSSVNAYSFKGNSYLMTAREIIPEYNEFKEKIKSLNSELPIFFVDKMKPIKGIGF